MFENGFRPIMKGGVRLAVRGTKPACLAGGERVEATPNRSFDR